MTTTIKTKLAARAAATCILVLLAPAARAELPTLAAPSRGGGDDDLLTMIQNYAFDFFVLAGLLIAAVAFFMVASSTMRAYSEAADGRGSMGRVGVHLGIGVVLLLVIVALVKIAIEIL